MYIYIYNIYIEQIYQGYQKCHSQTTPYPIFEAEIEPGNVFSTLPSK